MISEEYLAEYDLTVYQPKTGYRYNEDSFSLLNFVKNIKKDAKVIDLGAGCGILSLVIAKKFPSVKITAVEIQESLFQILNKNVMENNLSHQITPIHSDWQLLDKGYNNTFDVVITNPPFRETASGRISPDGIKSSARHETKGQLESLISTAKKLLKNDGIFYAVFLTERLADMLCLLRQKNIEPKELLPIYPDKKTPSKVFLVKAIKSSGKSIKLLPPHYRR